MRTLVAVAVALLTPALLAQDGTPPDPAELLRIELASPFLKHAAWTTDYDEALQRAQKRGQLVFAYFTTTGH